MSLSATGRELCGGTENTYKYSNVVAREHKCKNLIATLKNATLERTKGVKPVQMREKVTRGMCDTSAGAAHLPSRCWFLSWGYSPHHGTSSLCSDGRGPALRPHLRAQHFIRMRLGGES